MALRLRVREDGGSVRWNELFDGTTSMIVENDVDGRGAYVQMSDEDDEIEMILSHEQIPKLIAALYAIERF